MLYRQSVVDNSILILYPNFADFSVVDQIIVKATNGHQIHVFEFSIIKYYKLYEKVLSCFLHIIGVVRIRNTRCKLLMYDHHDLVASVWFRGM